MFNLNILFNIKTKKNINNCYSLFIIFKNKYLLFFQILNYIPF